MKSNRKQSSQEISQIPEYIINSFEPIKVAIKNRLTDFKNVPREQYFYELCYCICTPQSKAVSAFAVVEKLEQLDFKNVDFDITPILRNPENYIRFHNVKARNLQAVKLQFPIILSVLDSELSTQEKRDWLVDNVRGLGMKEAGHFLRNIGYRNVAILDRHILKHLHKNGVIESSEFPSSRKKYAEIERSWREFAEFVQIDMDELDLLFWSLEAGEILK
jgi:N-glycosylase/DNA lyase